MNKRSEKQEPTNTTPQAIRLDRPGVKGCGKYRAGVTYKVGQDVDAQTAMRLIEVKGFRAVNAEE